LCTAFVVAKVQLSVIVSNLYLSVVVPSVQLAVVVVAGVQLFVAFPIVQL
jgi:hypothetical protein